MTNSKFIPATFLAVAVSLTGLTVATAQTAEPDAVTAEAEVTQADFRGGDRDGKRGGGRRGAMFFGGQMEDVDADGNGAVTQAEIDTYIGGLVTCAAASGDGDLSLEEFQTIFNEMLRERMVDAFQRLDDDGDGAITGTEIDDRFGGIVERMDRNDDGQLDSEDRGGRGGDRGERGGDRDRDNGRDRG